MEYEFKLNHILSRGRRRINTNMTTPAASADAEALEGWQTMMNESQDDDKTPISSTRQGGDLKQSFEHLESFATSGTLTASEPDKDAKKSFMIEIVAASTDLQTSLRLYGG